MDTLTTMIHDFMATQFGRNIQGYLLPLACLAIVLVIVVAVATWRGLANSAVRTHRRYLRTQGITARTYPARLHAAQVEMSAARRYKRDAEQFYPLLRENALNRLRKAENELLKVRSYAR